MIEILKHLSLALSTGFMGGQVIPGAMTLSQSVVSLFKILYLIKFSSRCMTNSVTNVQVFAQVYFRVDCRTFLAHFLLAL